MAQTTVQRPAAVRFGSVKFEAGPTLMALVNIGALRNVQVAESWEVLRVESDNAGVLVRGVKNQQVAIKADWLEWDLESFDILRGALDEYTVTPAVLVNVVDEAIVLNDTDFTRFANKEGDGDECANIVVTTALAGATVRNTDYVIGVDSAGYTCIARIPGGLFGDGDTALVDYDYTPNASKNITSGGNIVINPQVIVLTNTNTAGKTLKITMYLARTAEGLTLPFPDDEADDAMTVAINLLAEIDPTRAVGDRLYEIIDEQSTV